MKSIAILTMVFLPGTYIAVGPDPETDPLPALGRPRRGPNPLTASAQSSSRIFFFLTATKIDSIRHPRNPRASSNNGVVLAFNHTHNGADARHVVRLELVDLGAHEGFQIGGRSN